MGVQALRPKDPRQSGGSADDSSAGPRSGAGGGLDAVDLRLLELLQSEGRITLSELGRRVNLSPAAVGERVRRLEAGGTITGYAAQVAPGRLGYGIRAFVRVSPHARMTVKYLRSQDLLHRPEVLEVHHVIGEDCWVFKVAARDTAHLEELIEAIAVLGRTTTSVILSSPVEQRVLLPSD
ncbi:AsnC family transcriptional regulator [Streptomyces sp. 1114.5]|uniref:Lrp/AsnC family transcriptional regulator n=1 Tax=unclassified Streptomyces TaxID=2593676 RepID=UPI000BC7251D|nr:MULTISPECIES: Lrp/AsnC family transcriptional regulator [unclassified Streptomyces]RKT12044.1 AsnC family transcriptional regulator [Streptomyces sp. 1114.5]SOB79997.1 transcriptional regulator, AsnC family [Streptomyces sp. 1331.2]